MAPKQNQSSASAGNNQSSTAAASKVPAYTPAEKAFVKENFKDEYHMLRDYGLSIYKEEDREEGRSIARGFMEQDEQDGKKK